MTKNDVTKTIAQSMAKSASNLMSSLSQSQLTKITFDFNSKERYNWHYIPKTRKGINRGELSDRQLTLANSLMASGLSSMGLAKANQIINHEEILGQIENLLGVSIHDRDSGLYTQSIFGNPTGKEPWGWRLEGHHLSLNYTILNSTGNILPTPSFFGANPAEVKTGPSKGLRILAEEEDIARNLVYKLTPQQLEIATIYPVTPTDIITRSSSHVELKVQLGLKASQMSSEQKDILMQLIKLYIDKKPKALANQALSKLKLDGIDNIYFAWAGFAFHDQPHYYRIHTPSFLIEYDNIQDMANHVHSFWRDIENDFGEDLLKQHYLTHHAH